jgi:hypothetical protein
VIRARTEIRKLVGDVTMKAEDDVTFLSHISRRWPRSGSMATAKQPRPRPFRRPPWETIAPWRWRRCGSMKGS